MAGGDRVGVGTPRPASPHAARRAWSRSSRVRASISPSGSSTDTPRTRTSTDPRRPDRAPAGRGRSATNPDDEPFTSHVPRHPCAPHPHPPLVSGHRARSRGIVEAEQPRHPHAQLAVVHLHPAVLGDRPEDTMAWFAPVDRIGNHAGMATAGAWEDHGLSRSRHASDSTSCGCDPPTVESPRRRPERPPSSPIAAAASSRGSAPAPHLR